MGFENQPPLRVAAAQLRYYVCSPRRDLLPVDRSACAGQKSAMYCCISSSLRPFEYAGLAMFMRTRSQTVLPHFGDPIRGFIRATAEKPLSHP